MLYHFFLPRMRLYLRLSWRIIYNTRLLIFPRVISLTVPVYVWASRAMHNCNVWYSSCLLCNYNACKLDRVREKNLFVMWTVKWNWIRNFSSSRYKHELYYSLVYSATRIYHSLSNIIFHIERNKVLNKNSCFDM